MQVPSITAGESLISYCERFARDNAFNSAEVLIGDLSISRTQLINNDFPNHAVDTLVEITGHRYEDLFSMSGAYFRKFWGNEVYEHLVSRNGAKYCAECLKTTHAHKLLWTFQPMLVCIEHGVYLITKCQNCGQKVTIDSLMNGYCGCCHIDYMNAVTTAVDIQGVLFKSQCSIASQIFGGGSRLPAFTNVTFPQYIVLAKCSMLLLEGLESVAEPGQKISNFFNKDGQYKTCEKNANAHANIYWMYDNFPENYYDVLSRFQLKEPSIKYIQKPEYEKILSRAEYAFVHDAYTHFWLGQMDEGCVRKVLSVFKKDPLLLRKRSTLTKEEVKNSFSITYHKIEKLCSHNLIEVKFIPKKKLTHYRIEKKSISSAVLKLGRYITRKEAADILGIQKDSIPKLVSAGILSIIKSPINELCIDRKEIEKLTKSCRGQYQEKVTESDLISFHEALYKYNHCGLSMVELINFTLKMREKPVSSSKDGSLADLYFQASDLVLCVRKLKEESQKENGYYLNDLKAIFNFGEKTIHAMAKKGILMPDRTITLKDGRRHYFYQKKKVDDFKNGHITIREAAATFAISEVKIRKWIKAGRLDDCMKGIAKCQLVNVSKLRQIIGA